MRVLHLPTNIASQMRVTVRALRELGVDAWGLTYPALCQNSQGLQILERAPDTAGALIRWRSRLLRAAVVLREIAKADVVHWHYDHGLPGGADVRFASMLGKKRFVEFWGSDIRDPEKEIADNPFFAEVWKSGEFEYKASESRTGSHRRQALFSRHGARAFVSSPAMASYLSTEFFPDFHLTSQRVLLEEYEPVLPSPGCARPLVVHAPTAPGAKGTRHVLAAVEALRGSIDFDFKLVHGMTTTEARDWIRKCDIFVDQLIFGEYGLASVEAMAFGKPTICYMKDSLMPWYPPYFPIVNANPATIRDVLRQIITDAPARRKIGEASRAWVEERHDARKQARLILDVYMQA